MMPQVHLSKWISKEVFNFLKNWGIGLLCIHIDEDEDGGGGSIDEFDRVDISEGVDNMHDEDIFEAEEVMNKSNIYEWGGLSVV